MCYKCFYAVSSVLNKGGTMQGFNYRNIVMLAIVAVLSLVSGVRAEETREGTTIDTEV
jgi:hypothetical protein